MNRYDEAVRELEQQAGEDVLIALATLDGDRPTVRTVNSHYEDGSFYVVTDAQSNKMRQIAANPAVGVCVMGLSAHGVGENLGHVQAEEHTELMARIRKAFASWYTEGDVDESNPNTCLLRIRLTDAIVQMETGGGYTIDFTTTTAS